MTTFPSPISILPSPLSILPSFRYLYFVDEPLRHLYRRIAFHFCFCCENKAVLEYIGSYELNVLGSYEIASLQKGIRLGGLQHSHRSTGRSTQINRFTGTGLLHDKTIYCNSVRSTNTLSISLRNASNSSRVITG